MEHGQLQVQHSVRNGLFTVYKASPFKELQVVKYTDYFDPHSDLVLIVPKQAQEMDEFFELSVLWNFWNGNIGLTRVCDVLELVYDVQVIYFAETCFDVYKEDLKCPKLEMPHIVNTNDPIPGHSHADSIINFADAKIKPLQSLAAKAFVDFESVANALTTSGVSIKPDLHYLLFKKALIQWSQDTTSPRHSTVTLLKDTVWYEKDPWYRQLIDAAATQASPADIWAAQHHNANSICNPILEEAMLALAASKNPLPVLDAIRRNTISEAILRLGPHQEDDARKAAQLLVGLFHGKRVRPSNSLLTEPVLGCMLDWMQHFSGARFSVVCSQFGLHGISKTWSKAQRRNPSHVPYAREIIQQGLLGYFISLALSIVNKESAKTCEAYTSATRILRERMLENVEQMVIVGSDENAHNLVTIFADTFFTSKTLSFSLLRWLVCHVHPRAYQFMISNMESEIGFNQLAEASKPDLRSESVLLHLCSHGPPKVRRSLKAATPVYHRLYGKMQGLLEDCPVGDTVNLFFSNRLSCRLVHEHVQKTQNLECHAHFTVYSQESKNLWVTDSLVTILEGGDILENLQEILNGTRVLDPRELPAHTAIQMSPDNRLRVYGSSKNRLLLTILSPIGMSLYPNLRRGNTVTVPPDSVLIVHCSSVNAIDTDQCMWLRYLLEGDGDTPTKRLLATHLLRTHHADLVILVHQ